MKLPVHRIIPFSNVEGYGNRTSIFVQGCNANCLYCHNSETIPMTSKDSKLYTIDELVDVIKHQMPFIRGITVSGGEATLHHKFLTALFKEVHKLGLSCYIDTNGFFNYEEISPLIEVTDKFLFDVKAIGESVSKLCFTEHLLSKNHLAKLAVSRFEKNNEHLLNLSKLLELDKVEEVRHVYVKKIYEYKLVIDEIYNRVYKYPNVLFKLIRMHHRGLPKERLQLLKGNIPSQDDFKLVQEYTKEKHFNKVVFID